MRRRVRIARRWKTQCLRRSLAGCPRPAGLTHAPGRTPSGQLAAPFQAPAPQSLDGLLDGFCPEPHPEEQIALNSNGLMLFVRVADIEWLEAADNHVALRVGQMTHCVRDTLAAVAAKLPPGRFLRLSPSMLVNIAHLKALPSGSFGAGHPSDKSAAAPIPPACSRKTGHTTASPGLPLSRLTSPGRGFPRRARPGFRNGDSRC